MCIFRGWPQTPMTSGLLRAGPCPPLPGLWGDSKKPLPRSGCCLVAQSCLTLCDPVDYSLPVSSVHGISQARILEWVAISFSRESSQPKDQICKTCVSCLAGGFLTTEPPGKPVFVKFEGKPEEALIPQAYLNPETRRALRGQNPRDAQASSQHLCEVLLVLACLP